MKTTLSSKGWIILPVRLREMDGIRVGQRFEISRLQAGEYLLKKIPSKGQSGILAWLRRCPEQGWFKPIESESTDTMTGL